MIKEPKKNQVEALYNKLSVFIKQGYFLNYDDSFTKDLIKSLLINEARYSYQACPCRLSSGIKEADLDIICPCDYRDADMSEFGSCYCGLYVAKKVYENKLAIKPIPERRPSRELRVKIKNMEKEKNQWPLSGLSQSVWRCQVRGYICARGQAPEICPICGAAKDRFEKFI